jgi:predicted TIM-barrel fold metal-dependent hydrolase
MRQYPIACGFKSLATPQCQNLTEVHMPPSDWNRRNLLESMLASAGLAASATSLAQSVPSNATPALKNKITLEEHFVFPGALETTFHPLGLSAEAWRNIEARLADVEELRLPAMDANGIQMQVVSLSANGVQGERDTRRAIDHAKAANDWLAGKFVQAHPTRFAGFAAVALQDPIAAAMEAERAVTDLGFKGVLVNGYTNRGDDEHGDYLDLPKFFPFCASFTKGTMK